MTELSGYRFTKTHEWVRRDGDEVVIGISEHAQAQLGDVIFLDLPEVGAELKVGQRFGTIESVKAASELYAPVSGCVIDVNRALGESPELVNNAPYTDGWVIRLENVDEGGSELLGEDEYRQLAGE